MRTVTLIVAIIVALGPAGGVAQELSTDVYPSEDELLEALRRGDIDQERYRILLEILREGIDSSTAHLLDEVPNLTGERSADSSESRLAAEQAEAFLAATRRALRGTVEHRYTHEVERDGRGSYRTSFNAYLNDQFAISLRLDRSVTGRERVVGRTARYRKKDGLVREVSVGSVSRRLGLGTVAGYRGKVLDCSDRLDGESFLYPDYGGANGGYVRAEAGAWRGEGVVSVNRDAEFALTSGAVSLGREFGGVRGAAIVGLNRLRNRVTEEGGSDYKYGGFTEYEYRRGRMAVEATGQAGMRSSGAVVGEGRHREGKGVIRYAGWHYGKEYVDLSGGSKAGGISVRDTIAEVGFALSSRRTGASGGMVRTTVPVTRRVRLETGVAGSTFSRDTLRGEALGGLVADVGRRVQVRVDYLERITRRRDAVDDPDDVVRRTRGEVRYDREGLAVRSYAGYTSATGKRDYWSVFVRVRYEMRQVARIEIWTNLGRIDMKRKIVDYAYAYGRLSQRLWREMETGVKVAHRYSRGSSDRHVTTIGLEMRAGL